jgi:hypothetical protein
MDIMDTVREGVWESLPDVVWTVPLESLALLVNAAERDAVALWEFWTDCRDAFGAGEYVPAESADAAIDALTTVEKMRAMFYVWQVRDALEA